VATTANSAFTTLTPAKTMHVVDNIADGNPTYGVGQVIRVQFSQPVTDKAAAEQAITVEASDGSQVKGHWFAGDTWLDLRPQSFWKPGTKVTVHRRTKDVALAAGVYGDSDLDETFTIGRSKVSTVDARAHMMTVVEDGVPTQNVPITAGSDLNPSWNGTMVVFEKDRMVHMDSKTTTVKGDAYVADDPHDLKITDTGSYVHGNPNAWSAAGHSNISHGCVGLPDTPTGDDSSPAGKYWADSILGDVVIVHNSVGGQVAPDNGFGDWNVDWSNW
jgi:lipoprotein-anchoring transpeptidase ErfK/SrfK